MNNPNIKAQILSEHQVDEWIRKHADGWDTIDAAGNFVAQNPDKGWDLLMSGVVEIVPVPEQPEEYNVVALPPRADQMEGQTHRLAA